MKIKLAAIFHAPIDRLDRHREHREKLPAFLQLLLLRAEDEWLRPFPAQRQAQPLPPTHLRTRSDHDCPRNEPVLQWNQFAVVFAFSFSLPFLKPTSFSIGHWSGCDRVSISICKPNDNSKQVAPGKCLTQHIINRVIAFRFSPLNQRLAKTDFFNLFRGNIVAGYMFDTIFRPDDLSDLHACIVTIRETQTNAKDEQMIVIVGGR